jgi:AraC-like DNA-binding protein
VRHHATALPAPILQPLVRSYIGYQYLGLDPGSHLGLPSPDLTVILSLGPPTRLDVMPDASQGPAEFTALAGGLHSTPAVIGHDGDLYGIELDITPQGARSLLGLPSGALGAMVVSLDDILGSDALELVERLRAAATWASRVGLLDDLLTKRIGRISVAPPRLDEAWRLIVDSGGRIRIEEVAAEVSWGRRHLTNLFDQEFGLTPKELARVARFDRTQRALRRHPAARLADVALQCGYYDQAHMAREWNLPAGRPASSWMATDDLAFVQGRPPEVGLR